MRARRMIATGLAVAMATLLVASPGLAAAKPAPTDSMKSSKPSEPPCLA